MKCLILLVFLFVFSTCQNKSDEQRAAIDYQFKIDYTSKAINNLNYMNEMMRKKQEERPLKVDEPIYNASFKMHRWRDEMLKNHSASKVISYSDSIINSYESNAKGFVNYRNVLNNLKWYRQKIEANPDSITQLDLQLWALEAETDLQVLNGQKIGLQVINCHFGFLPTTINKGPFKVGESIHIGFEVTGLENSDRVMRTDSLQIINLNSGVIYPYKILNAGPYYMVETTAQETGKYQLRGFVSLYKLQKFSHRVAVSNEYTVQ